MLSDYGTYLIKRSIILDTGEGEGVPCGVGIGEPDEDSNVVSEKSESGDMFIGQGHMMKLELQ